MFITTKDGKKIRLNEEDLQKYGWANNGNGEYRIKTGLVAIHQDGAFMEPVWVANIYTDKNWCSGRTGIDLEFQAEAKFNHEPTQEEMLYLAEAYGNGDPGTYVEIQRMYRWSCEYDD